MARPIQFAFLISLYFTSTVYCGEVTIAHAPSSTLFGSADVMRASDLQETIVGLIGYTTTSSSTWNGFTIKDPFSLPTAAVVVKLNGAGVNIRQEGVTYPFKENVPMADVYRDVKKVIGARAQRETLFKRIVVSDDLVQGTVRDAIPAAKVLNMSKEPDATFLREMATFVKRAREIEQITTTKSGGQDVIFMELDTLASLVKVYGPNSKEVREAVDIVRNQLVRVTDILRQHIYNDRVVVITATVDQSQGQSRPARSILQTMYLSIDDLNLASEYDDDYPVVFNIVLWTSIILILFIIFAAVSMATMDPGQDSIIYRMTNPRMKKDN